MPVDSSLKLKINDLMVSFTDEGPRESPAIIFIHGFPFNKQMWVEQLDLLKDNFRVIAYDVRGHGESELGSADFAIDLFADDLIALMDELKIEKALVCGISMGGYIALNAIEKYPNRFTALVLSDTQCMADSPESKEKRMKAIESIKMNGAEKYADASIINLFAPESFQARQKEVNVIRNTIAKTPIETLCKTLMALSQRRETCSSLSEIRIPVLILVGSEDKITPIASARFMNEKIKHSILAIINQAGHLPNLESPSAFNHQLKQFVFPFAKKVGVF